MDCQYRAGWHRFTFTCSCRDLSKLRACKPHLHGILHTRRGHRGFSPGALLAAKHNHRRRTRQLTVNTCLVNVHDVLKPPYMAATVAYSHPVRRRPIVVAYIQCDRCVAELGSCANKHTHTHTHIHTHAVRPMRCKALDVCMKMKNLLHRSRPRATGLRSHMYPRLSTGCTLNSQTYRFVAGTPHLTINNRGRV